MRPVPTLRRIVLIDYASLLLAIAPVVSVGIGVFAVIDQGRPTRFVYGAAAVAVIALVLLVLRVRTIRAVFREGTEVEGTVTSVLPLGEDRGQLAVSFDLEGRRYDVVCAVHGRFGAAPVDPQARGVAERGVAEGDRVVLVVDPRRPDRAFLRDLLI